MGKYSINKTPVEMMMDLAGRLRVLRKRVGYSQLELAERSGVSLGTLKRFEQSGKVSMESFLKLLLILGRLEEMEKILLPGEDLREIEKLFST